MLILKGASHEVNAVRFTPDGRGLVWSTERGDQVWPDWSSGGNPVAASPGMTAPAFSPDERYVLGASGGNLVLCDQTAGTTTVLDPELPASVVGYATFTPDGRRVIISLNDWPTCDLRCIQIEAPHPVVWRARTDDLVAHLAFVNAGRFVAFEYEVQVCGLVAVTHDAATGKPVGDVRVNVPDLQGLTTSPDRRWLVGYHATKFLVYQSADLAAGPVTVRNTSRKAFSGLAFHPAGRWLAATSTDGTVKLYDVATWAVARTFDWGIGRLRSVAFSPDGTVAAAGGDKGRVVVWDFDE